MDVVDLRSSSNDLSSAPNSDAEGAYPNPVASQPTSNTITVSTGNGPHASVSTLWAASTRNSAGSTSAGRADAAPPKTRKPRKKKDSDTAPAPAEKEKKPRKPRASAGTTAASRKKVKTENIDLQQPVQSIPPAADLARPRLNQSTLSHQATDASIAHEAAKFSQNGFSNEQPAMPLYTQPAAPYNPNSHQQQQHLPAQTQPGPQPPRSKPIFDPIRGVIIDRSAASTPLTTSVTLSTPLRNSNNPSTSPAISSIIHPSEPLSNGVQIAESSAAQASVSKMPVAVTGVKQPVDGEMEIDLPQAQSDKKVPVDAAVVKPVAKPRAKEQPPPLPTGSGLLSSSLFGGDSGVDAKQQGEKAPNIVLHVDLKDPSNRVINFARMAEEKYGFAALYPRQAAQKERLAKVAAAGAALERAAISGKEGTSASDSADENISVDIDRDSDNDGDVAMSGTNGKGDMGNSGTDGPVARKRRKRKDEYDADDPFVDDSEMLWEAQAAASKDGFFVYCGPLVPEGEKPTVERADGTVKRGRGRGRGGGPGSRGGRGGAASHAEGASSRGGGPGSRGGGVTRKPRITKAERQQRENEKKNREMMLLAAKPTSTAPS